MIKYEQNTPVLTGLSCLSALMALVLVISVATSLRAQVGFQATLETAPSFVSPYDAAPDKFSVALSPKSYSFLDKTLKRKPVLVAASHYDRSMRFNTQYYQLGRKGKNMIPVSVDASMFLAYRIEKETRERFFGSLTRSISNSRRRGRRGLGVSIGLPKRLNRIFGEGGAGLKVSGFRRITFSGRSQWTDASNTENFRQDKFPSLNMEQISRFDISGNIGSKITVKVKQDSQTDIPLANRIQIRYKGDDDDILKLIEAGNTNLSLPRTQFVGYSQRIRGLFGLKAVAQIGNLTVTGIASQEKGSAERTSFTATGDENARFLRDYDYAEGRIYDIGRLGDSALKAGDSVMILYVYEQERREDELEAQAAKLVVDPFQPDSFLAERSVPQYGVNQLSPESYQFFTNTVTNDHFVVFTSQRRNYALGIWMVVKRFGVVKPDTIGNISGDTLLLKLIRPPLSSANPNQRTWDLMWRNVYQIPRGVSAEDLDVKIFEGLNGSEKSTSSIDQQIVNNQSQGFFIEILGLDQYNRSDQKIPDGKLDERLEIFRSDWGLLIFPERMPFNSRRTFTDQNGIETSPLAELVPTIYSYNSFSERTEASKYFISISTQTRSSIIKLNRTNIIENSERIRLNGRVLTRGTDYNIDYDFGSVTLLTPAASDPNADLTIDYEYAPFFSVQKKTLLGLRGEYVWSRDFKIGGTILHKSDKAQDRKPRVGQETSKQTVFDLDALIKLRPNFLTKAINALPLIRTEAPSNISIEGELARSLPNPNTDGEAFVDDFEAALDRLRLGTSRTVWKIAPRPLPLVGTDYQRGKLLWHSPRTLVSVEDVYSVEARPGEGTIRTLRMIHRPRNFRVDTSVVGTDTTLTTFPGLPSWSGMMRFFNSRVDSKRAQLFEIRLRGNRGKIHFDFGRIREDLDAYGPPDSAAYSEDGIVAGRPRNGAVEPEEDVGLDGKADIDEDGYNKDLNPDPNGDNWYFEDEGKCPLPPGQCGSIDWDDESIRYEWINGTEGNLRDFAVVGRPDEEALSVNGFEENSAYFSFSIDLATDSFLVEGSEFGDPARGVWRTYRIPIRDSLAGDGIVTSDASVEALWSQITHVRVWFESGPFQTTPDTVEIADWYFVQSNWQDSLITPNGQDPSTTFLVASISEEDLTFKPPPGVEPYVDRVTSVEEPQRGLALIYESLKAGDTALVTKDLITVDRYSGYRSMEMYVRGDIQPNDSIEFFLRIGRDADNFYEVRTVIQYDPDTLWPQGSWIKMDFNALTGLKDAGIRNGVSDTTEGNNRVVGLPNLNEIRFFVAGVVNMDSTQRASGQVWMDELRVTDVRSDVGSAGRFRISGNLADLVNYGFSYQSKDAFFRGLSSVTRGGSSNNLGSGKTETNYSYNINFTFHKLLPKSWAARIPISYSFSKRTSTPLLRTNSDIVLPEEVRELERSTSESKSFSISESFNYRGKNPLFTLFLNRLKTGFTYGRTQSSSVNQPFRFGENIGIKSDFDLSMRKVPTIPILFWTKWIPILKKTSGSRLSLYPSSWRVNGNFNRSINVTDDINRVRRTSLSRNFNGTMSMGYDVLSNLNTSLRLTTRNDLSDLAGVNLKLSDFRMGLQTNFGQVFSAGYDPKLLKFISSRFEFRTNYGDDWDRSSRSRRSTLSRTMSVGGTLTHSQLFGGRRSSARRSTGVRNLRGGGAKAAEEERKKKGRRFYQYPAVAMKFLTGWIDPVTYSYSETFNNSVPGMLGRPDLKYRLGLVRDPAVQTISQSRLPSSGESERYSFSSGFQLFGGLRTTVRFQRSVSRDLQKQGSKQENTSTTWPDLTIRISKFSKFPLIKSYLNKFIDVFSPRTGFSRQTQETVLLDGGFVTTRSNVDNFSPLLAINFKVFRSVSLSGSYTLNKNRTERFNPTTGAPQSETINTRTSIAISTRYSFSSPGGITIPLLGKFRFRSTATIDLNIKKNHTIAETSTLGGPFVTGNDRSDISFVPVISYQFSQQIKGGLSGRWQDTADNHRNRKSHIREIQIWAEIRF